jgi:hypothetical protein
MANIFCVPYYRRLAELVIFKECVSEAKFRSHIYIHAGLYKFEVACILRMILFGLSLSNTFLKSSRSAAMFADFR